MSYDFLTVDRLRPSALAAVLADVLGLPACSVDVADADGNQEGRDWNAPVLCGYSSVRGDVSQVWDVYVQEQVTRRPDEPDLARLVAAGTGTVVLYPAAEAIPSAYWLITPEGLVTRARLLTSDAESDDLPPSYAVDAVEAAVPRLPRARVMQLPEILREERVPTPVTDAFVTGVGPGEAGSFEDVARAALLLWERMVRRMADDWRPSGRYPSAMYVDDLRVRDRLARLETAASERAGEDGDVLHRSVGQLDEVFLRHTVDDGGRATESLGGPPSVPGNIGWWWRRRPTRLPWDTADRGSSAG